jgi:hypothetical protein
MPVMRASRPSAKQKIGDTLYERLKGEHGKLAGKIVGMLLEGLAHEQLLFLCESPDDLAQTVAEAVPLLEIQRRDLLLTSREPRKPSEQISGIQRHLLLTSCEKPSALEELVRASMPLARPLVDSCLFLFCGSFSSSLHLCARLIQE